jgi:hypothetical protein
MHRHKAAKGWDARTCAVRLEGDGILEQAARRKRTHFGDGIANAQPMASDGDADVLEHLVIDLPEQVHADFVGFEGIAVLAKANRLQPVPDRAAENFRPLAPQMWWALASLLRQALEEVLRVAAPSLLRQAVEQVLACWRFERRPAGDR